MARFRPADDTAWADPDTDPRLHFSLVTDLRGVRGYDSTAGQRLSRELEIRFAAEPAPPDPDCTDLVGRVQWGIAPTTFPHFAFDADAVRVDTPVLAATYRPQNGESPAAIDVWDGRMEVQFPAGTLAAWLAPKWGLYAISTRYAPPLEAGERPLVCRPVGPDVSMEVPARLVIVVDGNSEVVVEAVGDGETDAFPVAGSAPDPEPTHSGITWVGALAYDGAAIELDFFGTIDEQWTLGVVNSVGSGLVVRVSGGQVGTVGDYPLGATISPANAQAAAPYFTMPAEGWLGGDPPQSGDRLIFTTSAAAILPADLACDASLVLGQAALTRWITERSGPALRECEGYPVYLETARGWGELTWRAVHNCPAAASEWLPGRVRFARDRPSSGSVWVYDRKRLPVGTLRLGARALVLYFWNHNLVSGGHHEVYLNGVHLGDTALANDAYGAQMVLFAPLGLEFATRDYGPLRAAYHYDPQILRSDNVLRLLTNGYSTEYMLEAVWYCGARETVGMSHELGSRNYTYTLSVPPQ